MSAEINGYTTPREGLVTRGRIKTLEQKVEVLEDLVEHWESEWNKTNERVRYMVAMIEQLSPGDSGVQVFGG